MCCDSYHCQCLLLPGCCFRGPVTWGKTFLLPLPLPPQGETSLYTEDIFVRIHWDGLGVCSVQSWQACHWHTESPWFGQGHDPCPDNLQHRGEDGQHSLHSDSADPTKSTANSTSRPLSSTFFSQPTAAPQPAFSQPPASLQPSLSQPTAANIVYRGQSCQATAFAYMLQYQKILEV